MRTEIGSEFWCVPIIEQKNDLFPDDISWFVSGRSALKNIILENSFKTVALPSWCCDSMIKPFVEVGIEVKFYPVYFDNGLKQDLTNIDTDAVLVMDYFGYTGNSQLNGYDGTVIRDVTHSIFTSTCDDADYYFGSLRKWAGFWTGGYAWPTKSVSSIDETYINLRKEAMEQKSLYICEGSDSKEYLSLFNEAEEYLEDAKISSAIQRDIELAKKIDIGLIKSQRRKNAQVLLNSFSDMVIFSEICENDCPMFVPILVPDGKRDEIRKYLIQQEIYCPVHWSISKYHKLTEQTKVIYDNELSLVCDQRYTEKDMMRIVDAIKSF